MFVMWLGAAVMTATLNNPTFANAYNVAGLGGLIASSFEGRSSAVYGVGKFVQLGLVFSTIASVVPTLYSTALSMQNVGMWAVRIPRFIWNTIAFIAITVAAIAGRQHFAEVLSNFLNCLSYWYLLPGCYLSVQGVTMGNDCVIGTLLVSPDKGI